MVVFLLQKKLRISEIRKMQSQMEIMQKRIEGMQSSEPFFVHPNGPLTGQVQADNYPVNSASVSAIPCNSSQIPTEKKHQNQDN